MEGHNGLKYFNSWQEGWRDKIEDTEKEIAPRGHAVYLTAESGRACVCACVSALCSLRTLRFQTPRELALQTVIGSEIAVWTLQRSQR